jgi:hypothetical protein
MAMWLNTVELILRGASREQEFIDWYRDIHLPDILQTPNYLNGRLYTAREFRDGRGTHITMYDIESDDIDSTMALRRELRMKELEQGHSSTAWIHMWRDVLWRLMAERAANREHNPKMERWVNLVDVHCTDASREEEFNDWYTNIHVADVLDTPGFMAAKRYMEKEQRDGRGKYFTIYEIETDDIDKTMAVRQEKRKEEKEAGRGSSLAAPVWRDVLFKLVHEQAVAK